MKFFLALASLLAFTFSNTLRAELNLNDLEFKSEDLKIEPKLIRVMKDRHEKLQIHQKLGVATAIAMTATFLLAPDDEEGGSLNGAKKGVNIHKIAGITSGLLYWTTAYYTWSAPRPDSIKDSGSTRIHRALAYVHVPLMALAPVLGYLHDKNDRQGKASTGLVARHGSIATAAYLTFMAAGLTMYFDF